MKKPKYLFLGITFLISFCCALYVTLLVFPISSFSQSKAENGLLEKIQDGDIIFQTSESSQCEAVRIATNSKFSHCGIIYVMDGKKFVFEAVQPVKITPLTDWIKHGRDQKIVVKRLKNAETVLSPILLKEMKNYGSQFKGKEYDSFFEWSDERIYCSELVWKIYKNGAGIELCPLHELKEFNLTDPRVQIILKERYGDAIPLEEKVVAPSNLVESDLLKTVVDTY
ncbi:YiiX family permuted papain-like enzyme [Flavobacterium sp. GA093]|uniref:YiiX family permuted papain-like enzyme n=1 Tax=Flavobacterium hydrocarbonoxydans TaxID=2683249 RepID=A0A6I4NJB7_9FLAO|nr:YiiX family permuted papain-like enzyme [Flavobacterium hydrocarbonoxydans]MWB92872.1 YiiX family permuted papain-like enzyme [Flavobacterium hydrocarbonoxydans]